MAHAANVPRCVYRDVVPRVECGPAPIPIKGLDSIGGTRTAEMPSHERMPYTKPSLLSQEADPRSEGAALACRKRGLRMACVDHAVDYIRIATPGDVIEATAHRQIVAQEIEAL